MSKQPKIPLFFLRVACVCGLIWFIGWTFIYSIGKFYEVLSVQDFSNILAILMLSTILLVTKEAQ